MSIESVDAEVLNAAVALRRSLHRIPDLSNQEAGTARSIVEFVTGHAPDEVVLNLGGAGVAVIYEGAGPGPTVMLRCELDALPISEANTFEHRSTREQISHKCGHDGHMAMVAGLAPLLMRTPPRRGRVVLLFQPAEETGEGAAAVLRDARFVSIAPDYAFAIHNIPGRPLREVLIREGAMAMGSVGMGAQFVGRTSHASEPERGVSPARALTRLLEQLPRLPAAGGYRGFALATLTHAVLGERSFGISPGRAEVLATLRAEQDDDLELLRSRATELVTAAAGQEGLQFNIQWSDHFAATANDSEAVRRVRDAASSAGLNVHALSEPMRWSEDFGLFTRNCKGALIGLGAGMDHPALHSPDYDFPDELIPAGMALFSGIINGLLGDAGAGERE